MMLHHRFIHHRIVALSGHAVVALCIRVALSQSIHINVVTVVCRRINVSVAVLQMYGE